MQEQIEIVQVPVQELNPAEYNPRKWDEKAVSQLSESIKRFGLVDPIIANNAPDRKNIVIGGHFRLHVAKTLGFTTIPVVYVQISDLKKEMELNLRLNKNNGAWDFDLLANFDDVMLLDVGFTSDEMDKIFDLSGSNEEDDFDADAELAKVTEPNAKLGDIYLLGNHRVMCGDSTKLGDVEKLTNNVLVDLIVTDPPYNVDYKGKTKDSLTIQNDSMDNDTFFEFLYDAFVNMYSVARAGAPIYIFHADSEGYNFRKAFTEAGFLLKQCCIWVKNTMVLGRQDYQWKHEPILYGWKDGAAHTWITGRSETTVWEFNKPSRNAEHPTMKPIDLICYPIQNSSERNAIVLDLFGGSGSTLIACEKTKRTCYMMEFDPKYVDVIIARWEKETGQKAVKQGA